MPHLGMLITVWTGNSVADTLRYVCSHLYCGWCNREPPASQRGAETGWQWTQARVHCQIGVTSSLHPCTRLQTSGMIQPANPFNHLEWPNLQTHINILNDPTCKTISTSWMTQPTNPNQQLEWPNLQTHINILNDPTCKPISTSWMTQPANPYQHLGWPNLQTHINILNDPTCKPRKT